MNQRFNALNSVRSRLHVQKNKDQQSPARGFGQYVFNRQVMQQMLPLEIYQNVCDAMDGKHAIRQEYADPIAVAMKEWAISLGATHFSHWFHPLTGFAAEKHDAFIEWASPDQVIERFSGKQLIQGEPDASSFPSGGLRSTFEARGYTGWDPTSPAFIWKAGQGTTLCIPSVYFSWTGAVLDSKIPLLRSNEKLSQAVLDLLQLTGISAQKIYCTIGLEQEYFVVDRALYTARPDLFLCGRTLFGAPPSKGQELQDHYFGTVKERVLSFMHDFEKEAMQLGIPVKTRHNEVAPAQHEVAPVVERSSTGTDHNIQLMELMRKIAVRHDLAVLLHEKPFHDLNGSGKHCNWSLATDQGINLLDPTETPENNLHFLVLLTAILHAVHKHSKLLRAAIGSHSNDCRLGGHEAPPAILSVYLGEELEELLENLEKKGTHVSKEIRKNYDLGISVIPALRKDNTDRNRTSPFAFTGNKFEFRAVGASQHPAIAVTVLNTAVAESVQEIVSGIRKRLKGDTPPTSDDLVQASLEELRPMIKACRPIRFNGDNYSKSWVKEALERGLPNIKNSIDAMEALKAPATISAFEGILTKQELQARYNIFMENYSHHCHIEANLALELLRTHVLPAAYRQLELLDDAGVKQEHTKLKKLVQETIKKGDVLEKAKIKAMKTEEGVKRAHAFCKTVLPLMQKLRESVDAIETVTDDSFWSLPKYRELLFLV